MLAPAKQHLYQIASCGRQCWLKQAVVPDRFSDICGFCFHLAQRRNELDNLSEPILVVIRPGVDPQYFVGQQPGAWRHLLGFRDSTNLFPTIMEGGLPQKELLFQHRGHKGSEVPHSLKVTFAPGKQGGLLSRLRKFSSVQFTHRIGHPKVMFEIDPQKKTKKMWVRQGR